MRHYTELWRIDIVNQGQLENELIDDVNLSQLGEAQ